MRNTARILSASLTALAFLSSVRFANAQLDINPPIPNVLLLVDSSGSMEAMPSGLLPEKSGATCIPGTTTPLNRWATLLTVLTGTIQNFSCYEQDRSSPEFRSEFALPGNVDAIDYKYYIPFHRVLSNGCTYGPGNAGTNWWDWPADAIKTHQWDNPSAACTNPFEQAKDGLLDVYSDRVRFGLMTFDNAPNPSTGIAGNLPSNGSGVAGNWSYYLNWASGGTPASGNPADCATSHFEVGARNPGAPPWEGRLFGFGGPNTSSSENEQHNNQVQSALLAMRPYGATPLAGMMADARTFFMDDLSLDPVTGLAFGPSKDPYYIGGCRGQFIVVLSDGEPNLDLRDACASGNGKCPYKQPYEIAHELSTLSNPIRTFAIGFGLSAANGVDCANLSPVELLDSNGICATATGSLKACCTLARLAYEGGTERAYFASDLPTLKSALDEVLSLVAAGSTTRTFPTFSGAGSSQAQGLADAAGYQFNTSFTASPGTLWSGNLERKRYVCENDAGILKPVLAPVDQSKGDDFAANLNSNNPVRRFFTVIGDNAAGGIQSRRSIRPGVTVDDGMGIYSGTMTAMSDGSGIAQVLGTTPTAMGIPATTLPEQCTYIAGTGATAATCAETAMRWEVGMPDVIMSRYGKAFGSIYHASPTLIGTPNGYLRDESYAAFAADPLIQQRPLMFYAATTDGQFHGFKVASNNPTDQFKVDTLNNNELWSFFPPYVLPGILPTYGRQALLLDGSLASKDVIFSRTRGQAEQGALGGASWRSIVVGSGGAGGGFYYALDVTNPTSPQFLWQVSSNATGQSLFSEKTVKPAITTIAIDDGQQDVKEVAVAILPGGSTTLSNGVCDRITSGSKVWSLDQFQPKLGSAAIRCWQDSTGKVGPARSLTIVRLDTGEVVMNFRGALEDGPTLPTNKFKAGVFDSPITGIPVPYPTQTGQVSDRIYIGDADGSLWRVDLRDPKPENWTVDLMWDAYAMPGDGVIHRQPIETPPIPTVDLIGNPVVLFSTGDQETFTKSTNVKTKLWSVREEISGSSFVTKSNWVIPFENGVRVTGPIALFNGAAYFSTFTPTGTQLNSCADGFGSIWGVDYYKSTNCQGNVTKDSFWPCPRYVADPVNDPTVVSFYEDQPPGAAVFGVSVAQTPSCYEEVTYPDPYLGSVTTVGNSTAGQFQLYFQTGAPAGANGDTSKTNAVTKALPPPRSSVRVDSWGLVLE